LNVTFAELREVVASNDKQRFSMTLASTVHKLPGTASLSQGGPDPSHPQPSPDSFDPSDYLIRANQGHSIKVDTEGLLTPITTEAGNVPSVVVHGTDEPSWKLILKSGGLRRMGRNHMHFASGLPVGFCEHDADRAGIAATEGKEEPPVISGMRRSSTVLIYIEINAALEAGIKFFISENGVILTEGNEKGILPYEFFKRVESRKQNGGVLMSGGVLPDSVVVDVEEWKREVGAHSKRKKGGRGGRGGGKVVKPRVKDDSADLQVVD
jgi:2'-phosphotransferase